jgi:selenocysteine lyase/cysteine desulfurase
LLENQGHFFNAGHETARFTPAGPDHAQIAAVNGLIDYFEAVYEHHFEDAVPPNKIAASLLQLFQAHEQALMQPLLDFLDSNSKIRLIGRNNAPHRAPTIAVTIDGHKPATIAENLVGYKLMAGAGDFYAYRLIEALGIDLKDGVLRLSFVHYTAPQEVDRLISALDKML